MSTLEDIRRWRGMDVHGEGEENIGEIVDVYLDEGTGEPAWLAVKTGMFGSKVNFVPIARAVRDEDHIDVPFTKDTVKDAPNVEADGELSAGEERRLYEYYGVAWGDFSHEAPADRDRPTGRDEQMTRSEEEMVVGTRREETGRARLRKYVVTEDVQATVPVSREEVRVEREPITEADRVREGSTLGEDQQEVTLHAEEPVVEKRVVPKERVRLEKDRHVEEETVSGEVRKEQIEADLDRD